jgi:hypothetical protein
VDTGKIAIFQKAREDAQDEINNHDRTQRERFNGFA